MEVLVTGGAGFIGSHLTDAYIRDGHNVTVLDNFSTGLRQNLNPDARVAEVDICDAGAVAELFSHRRFDLVNHHAAQLDIRVSVRDPQFDASQNIIGSLNILQACLNTGVSKVVFASSGGAVYGEQEQFPAGESHPTNPISPYGIAKLAVEKYLHYYSHEHGIRSVVFRYTNVYGPRQNPHGEAGVIAIFCDKMFNGVPPVINGDGGQTRDYVYIDDLVRANMLATDCLQNGGSGTFNVCTNTETDVNTIFRTLNDLLGGGFTEQHGPPKKGEQMRSVCSFIKAERQLGWAPQVDLQRGLQRTVEYYKPQ